MSAALALGLIVLTIPALLINLYFTALILDRWPRLRHRLGGLFTTCGADTSSCAIVVRPPYARLFGGTLTGSIVFDRDLVGVEENPNRTSTDELFKKPGNWACVGRSRGGGVAPGKTCTEAVGLRVEQRRPEPDRKLLDSGDQLLSSFLVVEGDRASRVNASFMSGCHEVERGADGAFRVVLGRRRRPPLRHHGRR